MRITILAIGSRGDTQPYVALAKGLQQRGYAVRVCAGDNFRDFVTDNGLDFAPVGVDIAHFINTRIPEVLETGRNTAAAIRTVIHESLAYTDTMWAGIRAACDDADVIGTNFLGIGVASLAEQRNLPLFLLHSTPLIGRTRYAPPMLFPWQRDFGAPLNLLLHDLTQFALRQALRQPLNQWRSDLDLPPLPRRGWRFDAFPRLKIPMLYAHSPAVLPRPSDWLAHWHVTGYWFLESDWQAPAALVDFLQAGQPPVYIGFGSMSGRDPESATRLVLEALRKSQQRGVLVTGWGGLSQTDLPDTVYLAPAIPHDWLFPQMAAVVHHGGAGTVAAGLRAGVPSIIIPHFGDQQFWGMRVSRLGVGVKPIPRQQLTADRLSDAIQHATQSPKIVTHAATLGQLIRAEDGIAEAIRVIELYLDKT